MNHYESYFQQKVFPAGLIPANCQQYLDDGLVLYHADQMYEIRPDLSEPAFWVKCHFEDDVGYTILAPNMTNPDGLTSTPGADDGCFEPGCYSDVIHYNSTNAVQIEALVSGSLECQQKIVHTCHVNALTNFAFWVGRDNSTNEYWHGDSGNELGQGCACSLSGSDGYSCSK